MTHPPPITQTPRLLHSTVETIDIGLASVETAGMAALAAMNTNQSKEQPPRPQQGGHRITIQYLQELQDVEARWAFRYVHLVLLPEVRVRA